MIDHSALKLPKFFAQSPCLLINPAWFSHKDINLTLFTFFLLLTILIRVKRHNVSTSVRKFCKNSLFELAPEPVESISYFVNTHFNIILPYINRSLKWYVFNLQLNYFLFYGFSYMENKLFCSDCRDSKRRQHESGVSGSSTHTITLCLPKQCRG